MFGFSNQEIAIIIVALIGVFSSVLSLIISHLSNRRITHIKSRQDTLNAEMLEYLSRYLTLRSHLKSRKRWFKVREWIENRTQVI